MLTFFFSKCLCSFGIEKGSPSVIMSQGIVLEEHVQNICLLSSQQA
jgi:hypothetical protein